MRRLSAFCGSLFLVFALTACGGGEPSGEEGAAPGEEEAPSVQTSEDAADAGAVTMPAWITYDEGANTATIELTAGETTANNSWNFNGYFGGEVEIIVPVGAEVTINFDNADEAMAHSAGVDDMLATFPANFQNPTPVFEGAITENPTSLTEATLPGESETITFTVDQAGEYSLVCYVPGHAAVGMYIHFTVSEDGTVGLRE